MAPRSAERWNRYLTERRLAGLLRRADPAERAGLYRRVYREFYAAYPGSMAPSSPARIRRLLSPFRHLLRPDFVVAEIGCGDGQLACAVSRYVRTVFAYDVADCRSPDAQGAGVLFASYSGIRLPGDAGPFDGVFSTDVLEHLHPDDLPAHLSSVYERLKPGGWLYCYTPNRLGGPHDISRHFARVAQGLHLQEYSNRQLAQAVRTAGFDKVSFCVAYKGRVFGYSTSRLLDLERMVERLPRRAARLALSLTRTRDLLGVRLLAYRAAPPPEARGPGDG